MSSLGKLLVSTLFRRSAIGDSAFQPAHDAAEGLEVEYRAMIVGQLSRNKGIATDCIDVNVRRFGLGPSGLDVFVGMIRLERWHRSTAVQLLLGLPLLEMKVRRSVRETWLADYSHFGGLWLHVSEHLGGRGELGELKPMMQRLSAGVDHGGHKTADATQPRRLAA